MIEEISLVITALFFLVVLSYYTLLFLPRKQEKKEKHFTSISVLIPARNEENHLAECLDAVLAASWKGKKQIIVINDGSIDNTGNIAAQYKKKGVLVLQTTHIGKSAALNYALQHATGELVAVVDADSVIEKDALVLLQQEVSKKNIAAATGAVLVKNRKQGVCIWAHIEQLYNSMIRMIFSKINANITTPGPLSVYRKDALLAIGGFSTQGYSEDVDVTIRLIRAGYQIGFNHKARSHTVIPADRKGFFRQRIRFAKGMLFVFKKHVQLKKRAIDLYTLPLLIFTYIQGVVMGVITIYQILSGYYAYFFAKGMYFNLAVAKFFFEWFSFVGYFKWAYHVFTGASPLTALAVLGICATALTYPLYLFAILTFDKKIDIWHALALFFIFPFWMLNMVIYITNLPEFFKKEQYNRWKKNEP
ncbi:MAG: glycosyltransferase family 2 protein [Candidatus Woesearchaeota archaeon]